MPFDGSERSTQELVAALQLAREADGCVRIVLAFDAMAYLTGFEYSAQVYEGALRSAGEMLDKAMEVARASGVPADKKMLDIPGARLGELVAEEALAWNADLVVLGTHGRRGVGRVLLGSGAEEVIRMAPVPVLVFRTR